MKSNRNTDLPTDSVSLPPADPDFNEDLPGLDERTPSIDPDASEFRDELQVGSYATAGALRTELEQERQEAEVATLEALEAMRAMDAGDQVKWRISRTGHESDELNGYLETWPNHLMTIERLRDRFGGGTFWCKGFRKGKYMAHKTLQISGEAKRKPSGVEGVSQSMPVNQAPAFDVQGFLVAQERRDERRREEERREQAQREEREEKRRQERLQLILALGPGAITALSGLFSGRQTDVAALVTALKPPDPLTMLTQLKTLQGGGNDGLLNKLLPMLIDMAGSKASGGDTGWLDVIKEFAKGAGPAVGGLIEAQMSAARTAASQAGNDLPPMSVTPSPNPAAPPLTALPSHPSMIVVPESLPRKERRSRSVSDRWPVESPDSPLGMRPRADPSEHVNTAGVSSPPRSSDMNLLSLMPFLGWFRDMLSRMLVAASRGKDPEVYAALFLEELPDGLRPGMVAELLGAPDWHAKLCQIEPRWNDARVYPWIERVRMMLLHALSRGAAASVSQTGEGGAGAQVGGTGAATLPASVASGRKPVPADVEIDRPTRLPSLTGE